MTKLLNILNDRMDIKYEKKYLQGVQKKMKYGKIKILLF